MKQCEFRGYRAGTPCAHCGFRLVRDAPQGVRRKCPAFPDPTCVHLAAPVGTVKVQCDTCQGKKSIDFPAHACEVHRRCLPSYRPTGEALEKWRERKPESDIYRLCAGCDSFTPSPTPPAQR